ncbi:hypothetical protein ZWY2020_033219 [Hordeum vulgare]|nr:hypothetical protein ZWY2020_033219 [Hordeum vulgare]
MQPRVGRECRHRRHQEHTSPNGSSRVAASRRRRQERGDPIQILPVQTEGATDARSRSSRSGQRDPIRGRQRVRGGSRLQSAGKQRQRWTAAAAGDASGRESAPMSQTATNVKSPLMINHA